MQTSTLSKPSAGTPKTGDPFAGSWDDGGFAGISPTAHAKRDSPVPLVHNRQISAGSSEQQSGFYSALSRKSVGFVDETQLSTRQTRFWRGTGSAGFHHSLVLIIDATGAIRRPIYVKHDALQASACPLHPFVLRCGPASQGFRHTNLQRQSGRSVQPRIRLFSLSFNFRIQT